MTPAEQVMRSLNPRALIAAEGDRIVFLEDVLDPDGRLYRVEVQATPDGRHAVGFCRHNPWGDNPFDYSTSHLGTDGNICLGASVYHDVSASPMDVETAIKRVRFWCTAYSVLRETNHFPQPGVANA